MPANAAPRSYTGYAGAGTATRPPPSTWASEKTASLEPIVGSTCVPGSSAAPKRRAAQPAIASRSSGSPSVDG